MEQWSNKMQTNSQHAWHTCPLLNSSKKTGDEGQGHHLLGSVKVLSSGHLNKNNEADTWLWAYYSKQNFITILQFSWCRHQAWKAQRRPQVAMNVEQVPKATNSALFDITGRKGANEWNPNITAFWLYPYKGAWNKGSVSCAQHSAWHKTGYL